MDGNWTGRPFKISLIGQNRTDKWLKIDFLSETGKINSSLVGSLEMTGVTGQTWSVFIVSGLMADRVKSSVKVSEIMTGLRGQITCSFIATGLKQTSNTLLESGPSDRSNQNP